MKLILALVCYLFVFFNVVNYVQCDLNLVVNLWNYSNPYAASRLCSNSTDQHITTSNLTFVACTVRFKICLDKIEKKNHVSNWDSCHYGSFTTKEINVISTSFEFETKQSAEFNLNWTHQDQPHFWLKIFAFNTSIIDYYVLEYKANNTITSQVETTLYPLFKGENKTSNIISTYISFSVDIKCSDNFYSSNCLVKCVPQNDCFHGHYTCDKKSGEKVCNFGFIDSSTNCLTKNMSVQLCPESDDIFCNGNGICFLDSSKKQTCCCDRGINGLNCNEIESCEINPCKNGATCTKQHKTYACTCKQGFTGKFCEQKITCPKDYYGVNCTTKCEAVDSCDTHQICDVNGNLTCQDGWGNFPECNTRLIDQSIDPECPNTNTSTPCLNGGSCWNKKCCCTSRFTGTHCEISTFRSISCLPSDPNCFYKSILPNPCNSSSSSLSKCSNNGICLPFLNNTGYTCACYEGYTGKSCDVFINNCDSQPCANNGTCISFLSSFYCKCSSGFTGSSCETRLSACLSQPCVHGKCKPDLNDGYTCECDSGWSDSKSCNDDINECLTKPSICLNNATCINELGSFKCVCPNGFTGDACQNKINYCAFDACHRNNSIECINNYTLNNFVCVCKPGYTGYLCDTEINSCGSNPCKQGSTCINKLNNFKCICPPDYTGFTCSTRSVKKVSAIVNTNPCQVNPFTNTTVCGSNGLCYPGYVNNTTFSSNYACVCLPGYTGPSCSSLIDYCSINMCQNKATCESMFGYYNCKCPSNYYGVNCEYFLQCSQNPCNKAGTLQCVDIPPASLSSYYNSSINFICKCRPGFSGTFCEKDINECRSNPCMNNGACVDLINAYSCECVGNYIGKNCETAYNFCQANLCSSGSTCVNIQNDFKCLCPANYTGAFCERKIDGCSSLPCLNGGLCQSTPNGATCICMPAYTGPLCSLVINTCQLIANSNQAYCLNNSTCVNLPNNNFYCVCPKSYTGQYCDVKITECNAVNTCKNGGLCNFDKTCICLPQYTGIFCENSISSTKCGSSPCKNSGTCYETSNGYVCNCPNNFSGTNCETKLGYCVNKPCLANQTCVDQFNSYICVEPCSLKPCQYGSCLNTGGSYKCVCLPGFSGVNCDQKVDLCNSTIPVCYNNATCITNSNVSNCICQPGYLGKRCEILSDPCAAQPCLRGTCSNLANLQYKCVCPNGFTGKNCEADINECTQANSASICYNNSTCVNTLGSYTCHCLNGFTGNLCEFALDMCVSNPCLNNGRCENRPGGLFTCICPIGYTGLKCEIYQTQCASNPCLNAGTCIINPPNGFQCICSKGYTGPLCEVLSNICDTNPCLNGGLCQLKSGNIFTCICLPNYSGDKCQNQLQKPCQSNPCKNGATCIDIIPCSNGNCLSSYQCFCDTGYLGTNCEILSNPCLPSPCLNQGVCQVTSPNQFKCNCLSGYSGFYCQINDDICQKQNCLVNFTNQALSIYSESDGLLFDTYRACILNTWQALNPIVLANIGVLQLNLIDAKKSLEFTNNLIANHSFTMFFGVSILNSLSTNYYRVPVPSDYSKYCSKVVVNPIVTYSKFWDLYLCGYYSSGSSDFEKIRQTLANVWRNKLSYLGASYSLTIDIFTNRIEYLSAQNQPIITRFQYLVYSSPYKLIIEKGVVNDYNRIPSELEFSQALNQNNFVSCRSNVLQPTIFTVTVCGLVNKNDIQILLQDIKRAWQSDVSNGGLGLTSIDVVFIDQQEFLTDDIRGQATKISYSLIVNGEQVDSSFSYNYDYWRILEVISLKRNLCVPNYAVSNGFYIITPNRLCNLAIDNINAVLKNIVIPSIQNAIVRIVFVSYGIEEVIDTNGQIFYQLPIFVIVNNKFLNPSTNIEVYNFLVQKFNSIVYKLPSEYMQAYSVYSKQYYRSSITFKFFFNEIIADYNLNTISTFIKQAFELTNPEYTSLAQVKILLQQDVILRNQFQTALNINRLFTVIINSKTNTIFDSRIESTYAITQNLALNLNNLNPPILIDSVGTKLAVLENIDPKNIVQYSELFVLYLTNYCLEINSNDLIKISSWLNNQWISVLKISLNIIIVNTEKYFDQSQSNVVIGINYLVSSQTPLCNDYSQVDKYIRDNFNTLANDLCNCGYQYYNYLGGQLRPLKHFYTLDLVGNVIDKEPVHRSLLQTSIFKAWSKFYPVFNNTLSMPILTNKFQTRLTLIGSQITRVFYIIYVNNQLASNLLQSQPNYQSIQNEFLNANSDLKVYGYNDSLCKQLLSSLFVRTYPLKPVYRNILQSNINTALQGSIYNPTNANAYVVIVNFELYQSQGFNFNVSRVYYYYNQGGGVYQCRLFDLYASDVYSIPNQKSFDYLVKSRYIDLMPPILLTDTDTLKSLITRTWLGSNNNLQISQINVNLAEIKYYSSVFASNHIQRVYYFITIANCNVNDEYVPSVTYYEPTISDFAQNSAKFANLSYYFPSRAFRTYIPSPNNTINDQDIKNYLANTWVGNNFRALSLPIDIVIMNKFKFFDSMNNYSTLIRVTYTILYSQYADQNDLFVIEPIYSNNFTNANCYPNYCLPTLFYDFYTNRNISKSDAFVFVNNIKQAWAVQNFQTYDIFFQNQFKLEISGTLPYGPNEKGDIIYRLIYSVGFPGNYGQQKPLYPALLDIYDLGSPNDANYNSFLSQYLTVLDRTNSSLLKPYEISRSLVDTVVGIQWWMILIIVIAFILIIILLILCVFRLKVRRKSDEKYENITSSESLNNLSRLDSNFRNGFETDRLSSNLRGDNLSVSGRNMNTDEYTVSTTSRYLDTDTTKRNLNLPQQYEAIIN